MLHYAPIAVQKTPHVVVVGNEKGGSGKTTTAMHVAIALLKEGQRVGTIALTNSRCVWGSDRSTVAPSASCIANCSPRD